MIRDQDIERAITDLAGEINALWNIAHSDQICGEVELGLQWLARQMDRTVGELRDGWDTLHAEPPLRTVEHGGPQL